MSPVAPWVLGISSSHNGAACLLRGDELVVAIQEERLRRHKRAWLHGGRESLAVRYCLQAAGITASQLSAVVVCPLGSGRSSEHDPRLSPELRGLPGSAYVEIIPHHYGHAVSTFATSGAESAAVLVADGVGSPLEDLRPEERAVVRTPYESGSESFSLYEAGPSRVSPVEKHLVREREWLIYPKREDGNRAPGMPRFRSMGGMFSAAAEQLFGDHMEAGKVMGLAPYGRPTMPVEDFLAFDDGRLLFRDEVPARFTHDERWPTRRVEYEELSASVQQALEEALLAITRRLRKLTGAKVLCYAGGVALNSVANERIAREVGFERLFVLPPAEDSGTAIGAAYHGLWALGWKGAPRRLGHDAMGRVYTPEEMERAIRTVPRVRVASRPGASSSEVLEQAVELLCEGKILGWFDGRSELGPRALGQRSILCDPRRPDAKETLNARVKHREAFRPFAPAILIEETGSWFEQPEGEGDSPYMLRVRSFLPERAAQVPGVVHVDGTGRLQTVTREGNGRFHTLLQAFHRRTGVPILLNTSFNVMGEPIVETPEDALWSLLSTGLDAVVLGENVIVREPGYRTILDLYPRVTAKAIRIRREIRGGVLDLELKPTEQVGFDVETPWGPTSQPVTATAVAVLEKMDGKCSGWELLERLTRDGELAFDEASLTKLLGLLRRYSVITFGASGS
jgi:carbamoyltransferase